MKPGPKPGPAKPKPVLLARRCKYCRATFVPERPQDKDQKFCEPNHRKAYFRYGGLPFDKMREQVLKEVRKEIKRLFAEHWNTAITAAKQAEIQTTQPPIDRWAYLRKTGATQ